MALTQGRARRTSFELPSAAPHCLPDASTCAYAANSLDQSATLGLLLAATAQQHQQQQNGGYGQPHYQQQVNGYAQPHRHHPNGYHHHHNGYGAQQQQHPAAAASSMAGLDCRARALDAATAGMLSGSGSSSGYDMLDAEEPGPLPCLPRPGRAHGSAGPYNSSAAALMMQQQGGGGAGAPGGMRSARPRRHSVTIGMLNEHQQQQQAAACAAAIAAAQQSSLGLAVGSGPAGQLSGMGPGMLGAGPLGHAHMQQLQQPPPPQPSVPPSPAMQQLTALSNMQAVAAAAAAQLGVPGGAPPMLGGYPLHAPPEPPPPLQQLGAVASAGSSNSPIMQFNGDLSALAELQRQPQLAGLGGGPRLPNAGGCRRHSWAPTGMNGSSAYALLLQQQLAALGGGDGRTALLGLSNPAAAAAYGHHHQPPSGLGYGGGDAALLNGSGPASGALTALSAVVANNMCGLQGGGMLPGGGYDALGEQQLAQRLLQLQQQQASLAAAAASGQRGEPSYLLEALLDPGSQAAGMASSFAPPLQVNGVPLDPQLLVSPFADNWDMISGHQGIAGLTPQQLASGGGGIRSPTGGLPGTGVAKGAAPLGALLGANGHTKPLNGSCGSSSSSGSTHGGNGYINGSTKLGSSVPGGAAAAAGSASEPVSAEAALAAMVASLPPPPKVCSDAPWDLKKAAEEDAKVVAAQQQQVDKLLHALQRSETLQRVAAASAAAAAAAAAAAGADGSQAPDSGGDQQVLFGYKLPDAGADAWGGAAASAAVESAPGSGCISQDPSNKLFIGNIGWWVTEEDLLHWFSRFGAVVNVKIMYNSRKMHKPKDKWRSREYGFIDYATPEEAAKAIVWMDGVELPDLMKDTCGIIVQYAKPTSGGTGSGTGTQQLDGGGGVSGEAAAAR